MTLEYYKIFPDWEEELNMLDDAARGRLLSALMAYAFRGEKVTLTGEERFLYMPYCRAIDAAAQKSATNAANGAKGGMAKAQNKRGATEPVANDSDDVANATEPVANDSDDVAECSPKSKSKSKSKSNISSPSNEGEGAKAPKTRTRFTPPTAEEVASYAREKGLAMDAEAFVDFYASKNWRVGSAPMKDWQASARNWARRDRASPASQHKQVAEQQYNQRQYETTKGVSPWLKELRKEMQHQPKVVREQQYEQRPYENSPDIPDWMMERWKEAQKEGTA